MCTKVSMIYIYIYTYINANVRSQDKKTSEDPRQYFLFQDSARLIGELNCLIYHVTNYTERYSIIQCVHTLAYVCIYHQAQIWRIYAVRLLRYHICSKCPPSAETHAGWSRVGTKVSWWISRYFENIMIFSVENITERMVDILSICGSATVGMSDCINSSNLQVTEHKIVVWSSTDRYV